MTRKIVTNHEPGMGWFAHEDPEGLVGCGRTEAEAVEDLDRLAEEGPAFHMRSCHVCGGCGIGQSGDPDTSTCHACRGSGAIPHAGEEPDPDEAREKQEEMRRDR